MLKKLGITIISVVLLISLSLAFANDELKRRERELENLKEEINKLDASIDANKSLQNQTNQKINNVTVTVKKLEKEINHFGTRINQTESAIKEKESEIVETEALINDKNDLLNDRLRVMYKTGEVGYLEVLFGAEDFRDFLSRVDMIQLILEHDQTLLKEMKVARDDLENQKMNLEVSKLELSTLLKDRVKKQDALGSSLNELVSYKTELAQDAAALKEMEKQAVQEADQMTNIIKNLKMSEVYVGGEMMWPVPGKYYISSPFGERIHPITKVYSKHTGIDIPSKTGTPVVAAQTGTVVYADWFGTYGKAIIVDHGGGLSTLYAHNNEMYVVVGQTVKRGETIAGMGTTGYSTGPHSHFEVRENGNYVNPLNYVKGQ